MSRTLAPSETDHSRSYEVIVTDDQGIVCECLGYLKKILVAYITGVRYGEHALCRHALQLAERMQIPAKQPELYWVSLTDGHSIPITKHARNNQDEYMLAYTYAGSQEPLETANELIFPKSTAHPTCDERGRVDELLQTAITDLVIATTGRPPKPSTRKNIRQAINASGAIIKNSDVTAHTTVLAAGDNPSLKKLAQAERLLTPIVDYPGLMSILKGKPTEATDYHGNSLLPEPP